MFILQHVFATTISRFSIKPGLVVKDIRFSMLYYHMSSQQQSHSFRPNPCLWSMNPVGYCMFSQWHVIKHETESRHTGSIAKIDFTGWLDRPTVATSNPRSTHYPYDLVRLFVTIYIYIYIESNAMWHLRTSPLNDFANWILSEMFTFLKKSVEPTAWKFYHLPLRGGIVGV